MAFDGTDPETCERCGFDSRRWGRRDAADVLGLVGRWWSSATAGITDDKLNERPAPAVWSALEYGLHCAMVLPILRHGIEVILAADGARVADPWPDMDVEDASHPLTLDRRSLLGDLEREGTAMARLVRDHRGGWEHLGQMDDGTWWQAEATLLHALHDTTHHFLDVGEGLARTGAALPAAGATVEAVNTSGGGVPKISAGSVTVGADGIEGDRQADRTHHGRPFQAVCLWSSGAIAELAGQGHDLAAGRAGENVTLSGLDWARLRPGTRLLVGTALLELSFPAVPCHKQARWFTDGDFSRLSHTRHPEWSRWYAWVRRPGQIRPGDAALVSPV